MRSDNRSEMLEQNVKAYITSKINNVISWCDFYEKIKSNKDFVKKYCPQKSIIGRVCKFTNA